MRAEELKAGYSQAHRAVIGECLEASTILVAHPNYLPDDTSVTRSERESAICGYVVGETDRPRSLLLHYVYVKQVYRRKGIARSLVSALRARSSGENVVITHSPNRSIAGYAKARGWGFALNAPFYRYIAKGLER